MAPNLLPERVAAAELPALPGANLPLAEQDRLQVLDESYLELIGQARAHGFSDRTIDLILAQRTRLYAERSDAWKQLEIYGEPLSLLEQGTNDEARSWIIDQIAGGVREDTDKTLKLDDASQTNKNRYTRELPYFREWERSNGLWMGPNTHLSDRVFDQYKEWLSEKAQIVTDEARQFLDQPHPGSLDGDITLSAEHATQSFYKLVFDKFDGLFSDRVTEGLRQISQTEIASPPRHGGRIRKIGERMLNLNVTAVKDTTSMEYQALSGFFGIARDLTSFIDSMRNSYAVKDITARFKRVNGIDWLETSVKRMARERLSQLVNDTTTHAFFDQFEEEIDSQFRRYSYYEGFTYTSSNARPGPGPQGQKQPGRATEPEDIWKTQPVSGETDTREHIIINEGVTKTGIRFDRTAIEDEDLKENLVAAIKKALVKRGIQTDIEQEVLVALCAELIPEDDKSAQHHFAPNKVIRRVLSSFHTDVVRASTKHELYAKSAGTVAALFKEGHLELDQLGDGAAITIKEI